ncbi:hypothetical protein SPURM210S_08237 [Streptomyces purpurascens]
MGPILRRAARQPVSRKATSTCLRRSSSSEVCCRRPVRRGRRAAARRGAGPSRPGRGVPARPRSCRPLPAAAPPAPTGAQRGTPYQAAVALQTPHLLGRPARVDLVAPHRDVQPPHDVEQARPVLGDLVGDRSQRVGEHRITARAQRIADSSCPGGGTGEMVVEVDAQQGHVRGRGTRCARRVRSLFRHGTAPVLLRPCATATRVVTRTTQGLRGVEPGPNRTGGSTGARAPRLTPS